MAFDDFFDLSVKIYTLELSNLRKLAVMSSLLRLSVL